MLMLMLRAMAVLASAARLGTSRSAVRLVAARRLQQFRDSCPIIRLPLLLKGAMHKLISATLLVAATAAVHAQDFKSYPMPSERERPDYVLGASQQSWTGGQINWYYNPLNQPANLTTAGVLNTMGVAAARWSGMCNVRFNYMGLTSNLPNVDGPASTVDRVNVFGWDVLRNENAAFSAVTKSWWIGSGLIDADIVMNTSQSWTLPQLEGIMTHEMGHALGLSHSNLSASVMFANPYNSVTYMATLRGDDANGCAALYGAAATADSDRAFNWAETAYAQYLSYGPAASGTLQGYYYRYYPTSQSYVGTRDGNVYYMGSNGVIQYMGTLGSYFGPVRSAGY